jgi:hypothetical protein
MSIWTHICGCIRFEYFLENISPIDVEYNPQLAISIVDKIFAQSLSRPEGSEGGFKNQVIYSSRGPVLVCDGDLRDFGKDKFKLFVDWLNCSFKELQGIRPYGHAKWPICIRDCCIYLESDSCQQEINLIMFNDDTNEFEIITKGV